MTTKKRTTISADDIIGLEYECKQCRVRYSTPIDAMRVPTECPNCHEQWFRGERILSYDFPEAAIVKRLAEFLYEIKTRTMGAAIRIEIVGDINDGKSI
jgi:hypothetical protein